MKYRREPGDHKSKDCLWQGPDGSWSRGGDVYLWGTESVPDAIEYREWMYLLEGEKAADALRTLGVLTLSVPDGAGTKLTREQIEALTGVPGIAVCPDNDGEGLAGGLSWAEDIARAGIPVKLLEPFPGVPDKGDAFEWVAAGGNLTDLEQLAAATAPFTVSSQPAPSVDHFRCTDLGNGERFVAQHGDNLRWCGRWKKWLVWDGRRWALDDFERVRQLAALTARSIYDEASGAPDGQRETLAKHAIRTEARERISAMIDLGSAMAAVQVRHDAIDQQPWLLNVLNGTIDLRTGELRPHDRADLLTKLIRIEYQPHATAPTFQRFLEQITDGDSELQEWLRRFVGYCLTGVVTEDLLVFFHGVGANGKSVFLDTMRTLLGDGEDGYSLQAAENLLMMTGASDHATAIADLFGRRLAICNEVADGRRLNEQRAKDLTGRDPIRARRMREDGWEFTPTHKLIMVGNHEPVVRGTDHGVWRRLRKVPFRRVFHRPEEGLEPIADPTLAEQLRAELPGILAWAVQGCLEWQRSGLPTPRSVQEATAAYREAMDSLGAWMQDRCILGPNEEVFASELWKDYGKWCEEAGEKPLANQNRFGRALSERGLRNRRSRTGKVWEGISLRPANSLFT